MKRRLLRIALVLLLLVLIVAGASAFYVHHLLTTPYRNYSEDRLVLTIPAGTSLSSISRTLESSGVVKYDWLLRGIFKWKKTEGQSKAGDYVFERALTPLQVYDKLMKGEMVYTVITVPEGSSLFELEVIFKEQKLAEPAEFRLAQQDPQVLADLRAIEPNAKSLEGFLFPDTYFLGKKDNAIKVLRVMLREFQKRFGAAERQKAAELGLTPLQVVTLASLVEKETGQPTERPLIAGVFHNRLKLGMLLQCDPTVIYAVRLAGEYKGYISKADLKKESPYNTYVSPGLPPGPICNPGADALKAVLYPEQTDKLYFVSRNDGSHHFSATLSEHNRAVQKYQR